MAGIAAAIYLRAPKRQAPPDPLADAGSARKSGTEGPGARNEKPNHAADEGVKTGTAAPDAPSAPPPQDFGRSLPVKADASPQAASVSEALKKKDHPERLSALLPAERFDPAKIEEYVRSAGPSRVFDVHQPEKDVPALKAVGTRLHRIKQGESARLKVQGAPHGVVSWTSFDLGTFEESKLNCVTVRADKDGVASVTFVATPGALNDCNILAGSPQASGQAKFVVEIEEK